MHRTKKNPKLQKQNRMPLNLNVSKIVEEREGVWLMFNKIFLVPAKKPKIKTKEAPKQTQLTASSDSEKIGEDNQDDDPEDEDLQQCKLG